ncbi:MAG: BON domain-containing protein [Holosporales bacterium]|jgi:osmotically-inducible protein OsmY|nr:BON domain-containing protein [Holosporales bacterium]
MGYFFPVDKIGNTQEQVMWKALGCCVFLSGCVPAALIGTAAVGTSLRSDGGISGAFSDVDIRAKIHQSLKDKSKVLYENTTVTVKEGRVLLTGRVRNETDRQMATSAVKASGVALEIFNEIQIGSQLKASTASHDAWLTTQIESKLLVDNVIHSLNYKTTTTGGVVYILGTAHTQFERDAVLKCIRSLAGVKKVVSYIRLASLTLKTSSFSRKAAPVSAPVPLQRAAVSPVTVRKL